MASLAWVYYSIIIRALQNSSTTRNLVPRFKRGVRGKNRLRDSNGSSRSWLLSSKRSIHYVDVSISVLQFLMMKSSSFLQELHRTYERDKGIYERTDLYKVAYLDNNIKEGGGK